MSKRARYIIGCLQIDFAKTLMIALIVSLAIVVLQGCKTSRSHEPWLDVEMEDNRRIYGDPYGPQPGAYETKEAHRDRK